MSFQDHKIVDLAERESEVAERRARSEAEKQSLGELKKRLNFD
jgi:hypothetical protein